MYGSLVRDSSGNLYGTTVGGGADGKGTVFELMPTGQSSWTESILRSFGNGTDGNSPWAGVIIDGSGNLYGTTRGGGTHDGNGTVFELNPPSSKGGEWTESILWNFGNGSDGTLPSAGLISDGSGNLYGTTQEGGAYAQPGPFNFYPGGTVFELTPPSTDGGHWTEKILWNFGNNTDGWAPLAGLIFDSESNLYGTTYMGGIYGASGTVFEINPTGSESPTPTATPTPAMTVLTAAPAALNFGNVDATGTSKPKKVTLTNKGKAPAIISDVGAIPPFKTGGGVDTCSGQTIASKKTCSFEVEYTPLTFGEVDGGFAAVAYNGTTPLVTLKGVAIGVTLKAPKSASFPPVSAGSVGESKSIVISNPSTVSVTLGTAMLGGTDPGSFKIATDKCSGQPLAPKGTCAIEVELAPPGNATGTQSATLAVPYTYGANQGSVSTDLSGKVK